MSVPLVRPGEELALPNQTGRPLTHDKRASRKAAKSLSMRNLRATTRYPLRVQLEVDLGHGWMWQSDERRICGAPCLLEFRVPLPATVGTGPMARRKRGRLIKEEQLGPRVGAEDYAVNAFEAQPTSNPSLASPERDDLLVVVVQDPAIPQPCATRLHGIKSTERIDTVLKRHHLFEDCAMRALFTTRGEPSS